MDKIAKHAQVNITYVNCPTQLRKYNGFLFPHEYSGEGRGGKGGLKMTGPQL